MAGAYRHNILKYIQNRISFKRDVANLLHEEAEARSIRERLRQKQQQQAQQNKKKSRDSWER